MLWKQVKNGTFLRENANFLCSCTCFASTVVVREVHSPTDGTLHVESCSLLACLRLLDARDPKALTF